MSTVTLNNITYDTDDLVANNGFGYAQIVQAGTGDDAPLYVAPMYDALFDANNNSLTTSSSNVTVGTGNKVFVLDDATTFLEGERVIAVDTADIANYMNGTVQSYVSGTQTLTIDVAADDFGGAGSISSWNIKGRMGSRGQIGSSTLQGNMTGNINVNGFSIVSSSGVDIVLAPGAATDAVDIGGSLVRQAQLVQHTESAPSSSISGAVSILLTDGNVKDYTLTGNVTFTFPSATSGISTFFTLVISQDGTGGHTITWPGSVDWADGTAPTLSTGSNEVDILTFFSVDGGTTWYGMTGGLNFS